MIIVIVLFILGLLLIVKGGDIFVDSAVKVSKATGLPELFIGATIVSLATTIPEVTVSSTAALKGFTTMSIGNSIGSIICNTGLILGLVNLISPSSTGGRVFRVKSLILVLFIGIFGFLSLDRSISQVDGFILLGLLVGYVLVDTFILKYKKKHNHNAKVAKLRSKEKLKVAINFFLGVAFIIAGANLLINNGVRIAEYIGVPEAVISLTMIALGTSLPELVASVSALVKGYAGLSIGNILGANILNIAMVLGISGSISDLKILKQNLVLDIPMALVLTLIVILPSLVIKKVSRAQGAILLIVYVVYLFLLYTLYL